ncbi:MAG: putative zinc-binding peptidase [Geminicoccaceae bacterium]|nr:putative zinc-binding peptidase [Geminicoccaceae bacterium]
MKLFKCQHCGQLLYFENTRCERCGHRLGYLPEEGALSALDPAGEEVWRALAPRDGVYRFCVNAADDACNWLLPADAAGDRCLACRHNRTIPNLHDPVNLLNWRKMERAKHRLFYTLIKLGLPLPTRAEHPQGLVFDVLADPKGGGAPKVMTGHADGLITINLAEADDAERERLRTAMGEPYRTLLGHFRHEVGHFFWDQLVRDRGNLEGCRALFGDDREDYGEALKRHYAGGAPPDWQERYVSAYASTHPWEDWAETWAHYLHIVDTLETASAFGLRIHPKVAETDDLDAVIAFDPHQDVPMPRIIGAWLPLAFAVNSLNRSMGHQDLYPFVISPPVVEKLAYIHALVHQEGAPRP